MRTSWRIFRIFGIEIRIDSSWIFIFGLITWALAGHYFPSQYPRWPHWQYWLVGTATSLLLFSSVLAHELTHSLVARSKGEEVRSITLFLFGGVAEIAEEPKTPAKEFSIALVGPISSLIIAGIFFVLWYGIRGISEPIAALARYLSIINLFLALFNMVPGFPLDGGRVLRAIAWKLTGDMRRATRIASVSGQVVAFLLIFFGVWQILSGFFFNGLWIALIGWFIHSAAVRGYRQVLVKEMLKDVRAKDLMDTTFDTIDGSLSVQELMEEYILKKKERAFLVTEAGKLAGIVCLEDVKAVPSEKRTVTTVREIMTPRDKLEAVSPEEDGSKVLGKLASGKIHQVPVIEGGEVKGVVCRADILDFLHLRSELGV
ncbi:MAG: site-2 protease family protein [Deltaproteobacteria bacterium]|nr:MAG: site-2 protease family protein [Deltaproteobacteria bacterium]